MWLCIRWLYRACVGGVATPVGGVCSRSHYLIEGEMEKDKLLRWPGIQTRPILCELSFCFGRFPWSSVLTPRQLVHLHFISGLLTIQPLCIHHFIFLLLLHLVHPQTAGMPLRLDIKRQLSARSDRVKCVDMHPSEPWMLASLYNGTVQVGHLFFKTSKKEREETVARSLYLSILFYTTRHGVHVRL